jgi:hypothetical protein
VLELALTALGLGLAGIDPAGLLIALGALAAGVRERVVVGFAAAVVLGTAVLGTALSLTLGQELQDVDWGALLPPDRLGAVLEVFIAVGLLAWAVVRVRRPEARPARPRRASRSGTALLGAGALFAASAPLDPTFVGLVVVAGRAEEPAAVAAAHLLWILVSQVPLVALAVAVLLRRHGRAVAWLQRVTPRMRPLLARLATAGLVVAGLVLAVDAGWWFVTGRFLLPDPT